MTLALRDAWSLVGPLSADDRRRGSPEWAQKATPRLGVGVRLSCVRC